MALRSFPRLLQQTARGFFNRRSLPLTQVNRFLKTRPDVTHEEESPERLDPVDAGNMMDIGIRKIFNEDHDIFRTSVRKFFQEEVKPNIDKYEKQGQVDREVWLKAGAHGILGAAIPAAQGGVGGDVFYSAITWEEQSYINDAGCGFPFHNELVMPYLSHYGTPDQVTRYIRDMTAGRAIGAIAMTEPAAGSDLQGIKTHAKRDGDDWILNGSKVFITNGWLADVVIVVALTNPEAKSPAHGFSLFLVEEGMPGFKKGKKLEKMGMKGQDTAELFFDDVRLPSSAILGGEVSVNKGFYHLMDQLSLERLLMADLGISACEWMFEETRAYVKQRKAFKKTISSLQTVQHKLAEMKTSICVARSFLDDCILAHSKDQLTSQRASMAKYWCTELQNKVAYDCVQLHGGWGYMWEYGISRAYVNARPQTIYAGATEIMKELIARRIVHD